MVKKLNDSLLYLKQIVYLKYILNMKSCWIKKENITPELIDKLKELGYIQFQKYFSCDDWEMKRNLHLPNMNMHVV